MAKKASYMVALLLVTCLCGRVSALWFGPGDPMPSHLADGYKDADWHCLIYGTREFACRSCKTVIELPPQITGAPLQ